MSSHTPTLDSHVIRGGTAAIRNARQGTLALAAMALVLAGPALGLAFLLSHGTTLKRVDAVKTAWAAGDVESAQMLEKCLNTEGRGKSKMMGALELLSDIEKCENNLLGMSNVAAAGLGPDIQMPSVVAVEAAISERKEVFHTTFFFNPADF